VIARSSSVASPCPLYFRYGVRVAGDEVRGRNLPGIFSERDRDSPDSMLRDSVATEYSNPAARGGHG